ncbi:MAG TPA: AMP-binding protein [Phycisphaerae bacterium]|jgi:phenylacetate-CoA ligase|nr:phenylacetate--CoA ligase family protein [Phycisphaerae bacterium]HOB73945.1 AMP-binding protein [Phycisphaerae bacterium]HOJ55333.1 AMP-binding protein [Phycisphaerae bacterium]HOL25086.1 AMP-binding protein [Phycisphaerae bacterium]HPP19738.1 AMP-binding protein [Phycisphaerae bacterium]
MSRWLSVYHRLPYPLRVMAASARGYYLNYWRQGRSSEQLITEAHQRETWDSAAWKVWRDQRLRLLLERAATQVPYYRDYWSRRKDGEWARLENWPILKKDVLRENPGAFVADGCDRRRMFSEHTSGTTGKPLSVWWSRRTAQEWYALFEARARRWHGVSDRDRWVHIGGQLVTPFDQKRPPFWVWNFAMRQLYMSSYHLCPENISAYLDAMRRHRVRYMLGYSSSMYTLARLAEVNGLEAPRLAVVISNAEPLFAHQRETISRVFGCPVRETYGMTEIVCAASECEQGSLHIWPDVGVLEILEDDSDKPAEPGQPGRVVATGLLNMDMPLVRYEVGDRAVIDSTGSRCACGRGLPLLRSVEGRSDDTVLTPDGRTLGRITAVFKTDLPIQEAQVEQQSLCQLLVRIVPLDDYKEADGQSIIERLRERVGNTMAIRIELVDSIPRTANGKFRTVISRLSSEDRELAFRGQASDTRTGGLSGLSTSGERP